MCEIFESSKTGTHYMKVSSTHGAVVDPNGAILINHPRQEFGPKDLVYRNPGDETTMY